MSTPLNHSLQPSFKALEVSTELSWEELQDHYRRLVQHWHPDRHSGKSHAAAQTRFIEINAAFKLLRAHYRLHGSLPEATATCEHAPLLGVPKIKPSLFVLDNIWVRAGLICVLVAILLTGLLLALDSRATQQIRDQANIIENSRIPPSQPADTSSAGHTLNSVSTEPGYW